METHKIDSLIKNAIHESNNFYDSVANNAKERIWNQVQPKKKNHPRLLLFPLLVAASVLLFVCLSVVTISNVKNRNTIKKLVELNNALRNESIQNNTGTLIKRENVIATNTCKPDTVYFEKKIIEYKPLVTIKQTTDTIYIQQITNIEVEQKPASLTVYALNNPKDSIIQTSEDNFKSEILITNNESFTKEKRKKIQIKFGGNKDQTNGGTLALTTKL